MIQLLEPLSYPELRFINRLDTFKKKDVVLDYDNTLLFSEKADARFTYKKERGYSPGVGMIGKHVVYVENRNGNSAAHILQDETFKRMAELLEQEGIKKLKKIILKSV